MEQTEKTIARMIVGAYRKNVGFLGEELAHIIYYIDINKILCFDFSEDEVMSFANKYGIVTNINGLATNRTIVKKLERELSSEKVYTVQTIETNDTIPTVKVEVFSTREKAKEYFDEQVQWYKDQNDMENYGVIEDETDDSFSWTAEIGFNEDALEITINELEVK